MLLSGEEMVDMIFVLGECQRNPLLASRVYAQRYPERRHPQTVSFQKLLERFVNSAGSVAYSTKNYNGRVVNEENEFVVLGSVQENPRVSTREISRTTGISATSVRRILKKHKYHPFHIQLHQELRQRDFAVRQEFCQWAMNRLDEDEDFFKYVLFSDESTFHKNGFVNRHNCHYYDTENPHEIQASLSQFRWSLNVWGGVLGNRVVGPIFFDGHLTGRRYLEFLQTDLQELLEDIPLAVLQRMWLQHDGAPSHSTLENRNYLNDFFPNRWIGRGGPINWPARSPDLTKCDFFFVGHY